MSRRQKQQPSFAVCKANALRKLAEADKSPKGCLDPHIAPLVHAINAHPDYVTTSSCAGRVVLWAEGSGARAEADGRTDGAGGRWLLCHHDRVSLAQIEALVPPETVSADAAQVAPAADSRLCLFPYGDVSSDEESPGVDSRQVTLKHEPAILHVQCRHLGAAQSLLSLALSSGFRESGIVLSGSQKVCAKLT